jgi:hypothetical protein
MKWFMYGIIGAFLLASLVQKAYAHEMTPTYPKLRPSHLDNVYVTTMEMFNKRNDVEYYEIGVFDKDFKPIPFVSSYTIINIKYLGHVTFDIYIRKEDVSKAEYVCSTSKLRKDNKTKNAVSSRICSKFK